jgi:hypothetical protein
VHPLQPRQPVDRILRELPPGTLRAIRRESAAALQRFDQPFQIHANGAIGVANADRILGLRDNGRCLRHSNPPL